MMIRQNEMSTEAGQLQVRAFADAYELDELDDMHRASSIGDPGAAEVSDADRVYLGSLVGWLRLFVECRAAGEEF